MKQTAAQRLIMSSAIDRPRSRLSKFALRYVIQRLVIFAVFAAVLFWSAGTLRWTRGWIYFLFTLLIEAYMQITLAVKAPETLNHRGIAQVGVKPFDRVFAVIWAFLVPITAVVAGLDAVRFKWSSLPFGMTLVGAVWIAIPTVFATWAMLENEHFEQLVRIQTDRKHRVVTTGPYRIVRHPGYAAIILSAPGTPLMLGSCWTFIPTAMVMVLFVIRTALEDRTLRQELDGYAAYAERTRYRLLPGVW